MTSDEKRILVVEDDPDMLETFLQVLEVEGYVATGAINGQDALEKLAAGLRPRLILLDLMMPVMTGWELDEKLAADPELASIPVVFVSAAGLPPEAASARPATYLRKPLQLDDLLATIRRFCP